MQDSYNGGLESTMAKNKAPPPWILQYALIFESPREIPFLHNDHRTEMLQRKIYQKRGACDNGFFGKRATVKFK